MKFVKEKLYNIVDNRDNHYLGTYVATSIKDAQRQFQGDAWKTRQVKNKHLSISIGV